MHIRPRAAARRTHRRFCRNCGRLALRSCSLTPIRSLLLLLALVSLVGMPYTVLMPIFADTVLHGGAHTLGFLMAASGVGALVGGTAAGDAEERWSDWGRVIVTAATVFRRSADRLRSFALAAAVAADPAVHRLWR